MEFYYNEQENLCADEYWVAYHLWKEYPKYSMEEHIERLRTCRSWCDWYACNVCENILDAMVNH